MSLIPSKLPVVLTAAFAGAGLVAIAAVVTRMPSAAPAPLKPAFAAPGAPAGAAKNNAVTRAEPRSSRSRPSVREGDVVRAVSLDGEEVKLDRTVTVPSGANARVAALQASVRALGYDDVRVLGASEEAGNLIVDVSPSLLKRGFGSMEESNFIKGLRLTLGQFGDVKSFQLRSDGQILDTLGHFEMTEPVPIADGAGENGDGRDAMPRP